MLETSASAAVATRLVAAPGFRAERDATSMRILGPRLAFEMPPLGDGARAAFAAIFAQGVDATTIADGVLDADGFTALALFSYVLVQLETSGAIARTLLVDGRAFATAVPIGAASSPRPVPPATRARLSRFCAMRRRDEHVVLESGLARAYVVLESADAQACAATLFEGERNGDALDPAVVAAFVALLAEAGLLDDADAGLPTWEFHDLLFHAHSRLGRNPDGYGGTFRFGAGEGPLPAVAPARSATRIALARPDLDTLQRTDVPLQRAIETRASIREHGDVPLSIEALGEFFFRIARAREDGSRPYPAGGGLYELEFYATVDRCVGLERGIYAYRPGEHALEPLAADIEAMERLLQQTATTMTQTRAPQVLITLTARFERVAWKYESVAYALVLKHVGVLYEAMYLAATAMQLAPCALGGGDSDLFGLAAGLTYGIEGAVGEFALGSRAAS